jgi:hypothetical protein
MHAGLSWQQMQDLIYHSTICNQVEIIFTNVPHSTVKIAWDIFRILVDYRLRHLVNNVAMHIYTHDYIRMEIIVLYLKSSRHQLSI